MRKALYRKYRSKSFSEVVGQEPIKRTLQNALDKGQFSHAYLFTGPKGVGKTTIARILAHEINGVSYDHDKTYLDIIEIDAASNRRIDEVRDLRDKVYILPSELKYKVYIIDEVHMLTKEAFNALLKTLEEPPAHCVFIMATTELAKVPETIISRTQRFTFQPISKADMSEHLMKMALSENLKIEKDALEVIVSHSDGSLRDAISYIDQLSSTKIITAEIVNDLIGLPPKREVQALLTAINQSDQKTSYQKLKAMLANGHDPVKLSEELLALIKNYFANNSFSTKLLVFSRQLLNVDASIHPAELLELAVLEATQDSSEGLVGKPLPKTEATQEEHLPSVKFGQKPSTDSKKPAIKDNFSAENWPDVLTTLKTRAPSLYTALRLAEIEYGSGKLTLAFQFPLHKKKVETAQNLSIIKDVLGDFSGQSIEIICLVSGKAVPPEDLKKNTPTQATTNTTNNTNNQLDTITNIFGGAELLES